MQLKSKYFINKYLDFVEFFELLALNDRLQRISNNELRIKRNATAIVTKNQFDRCFFQLENNSKIPKITSIRKTTIEQFKRSSRFHHSTAILSHYIVIHIPA